ncbi:unnamed protein product [Periconia digitata]|uniref:Uncharacterized protein n=1 Tax=Periconia digitata TaxID=1303443 RepID=A0A9W4UA57_9PLEO|nr:unnamed protein product [Periconia digitata]
MQFTTFAILAILATVQARVLPRQNDAQKFTGALGGIKATPVLDSGNADRPFFVKGDTFVNAGAALQRSCDQQMNACMNLVNSQQANFKAADCQAQQQQCNAAA